VLACRTGEWGNAHRDAFVGTHPALRVLTPQGVTQELDALVLAQTLVRTVMLHAAREEDIGATRLSFTAAVCILDNHLPILCRVTAQRRAVMPSNMRAELGQHPLPIQRVRIQARVLTRAYPRSPHKKPEHWQAPALELDLDFYQIIQIVPILQRIV